MSLKMILHHNQSWLVQKTLNCRAVFPNPILRKARGQSASTLTIANNLILCPQTSVSYKLYTREGFNHHTSFVGHTLACFVIMYLTP